MGQNNNQSAELQQENMLGGDSMCDVDSFGPHPLITAKKGPRVLPEQGSIQVTGVKVTLDPSLPALVQLTGFIALQWRSVFIYPLAAPLGKCWNTPRL